MAAKKSKARGPFEALRVLKAQKVVLLGLEDAISDAVESALSHTLSTAPGGAPDAS